MLVNRPSNVGNEEKTAENSSLDRLNGERSIQTPLVLTVATEIRSNDLDQCLELRSKLRQELHRFGDRAVIQNRVKTRRPDIVEEIFRVDRGQDRAFHRGTRGQQVEDSRHHSCPFHCDRQLGGRISIQAEDEAQIEGYVLTALLLIELVEVLFRGLVRQELVDQVEPLSYYERRRSRFLEVAGHLSIVASRDNEAAQRGIEHTAIETNIGWRQRSVNKPSHSKERELVGALIQELLCQSIELGEQGASSDTLVDAQDSGVVRPHERSVLGFHPEVHAGKKMRRPADSLPHQKHARRRVAVV